MVALYKVINVHISYNEVLKVIMREVTPTSNPGHQYLDTLYCPAGTSKHFLIVQWSRYCVQRCMETTRCHNCLDLWCIFLQETLFYSWWWLTCCLLNYSSWNCHLPMTDTATKSLSALKMSHELSIWLLIWNILALQLLKMVTNPILFTQLIKILDPIIRTIKENLNLEEYLKKTGLPKKAGYWLFFCPVTPLDNE